MMRLRTTTYGLLLIGVSPLFGVQDRPIAHQTLPGVSGYGKITGKVTDAMTGEGIPLLLLGVYNTDGSQVDWIQTDALGGYESQELPEGTCFAVTDSDTYLDELYDGLACEPQCDPTAGVPIPVIANQTTPGIDFAVDLGGSISGTVTEAGTGRRIIAEVYVYDAAGEFINFGYTNGSGYYRVEDLPQGSHYLVVWPDIVIPYANELYDDILCEPSCDPTQGDPVPVTLGQETPGIDFTLEQEGKITGTVVDATDGASLESVIIYAYNEAGDLQRTGGTVAPGYWEVEGLLDGAYYVVAASQEHLDELYDDVRCESVCDPTVGTAIPVAIGEVTMGVDFALVPIIFADGFESGNVFFWSWWP